MFVASLFKEWTCSISYPAFILKRSRNIIPFKIGNADDKIILVNLAAPCSAGSYMTESGCQQCGENTFSGPGASSCTSCPDDKIAPAVSTSEDDCYYGKNVKLINA